MGSEMCIRDSYIPVGVHGAGAYLVDGAIHLHRSGLVGRWQLSLATAGVHRIRHGYGVVGTYAVLETFAVLSALARRGAVTVFGASDG